MAVTPVAVDLPAVLILNTTLLCMKVVLIADLSFCDGDNDHYIWSVVIMMITTPC